VETDAEMAAAGSQTQGDARMYVCLQKV